MEGYEVLLEGFVGDKQKSEMIDRRSSLTCLRRGKVFRILGCQEIGSEASEYVMCVVGREHRGYSDFTEDETMTRVDRKAESPLRLSRPAG